MNAVGLIASLASKANLLFDKIMGSSLVSKIEIFIGTVLTAYFAPIVGLIVTCFILTFTDMCYGIAVAKKFKLKITSDKNWHGTINKLLHTFILICLSHMIEYQVFDSKDITMLSGGVAVIISVTELWSILENLNTLYPNGPWKSLGVFLKKKCEDHVGIDLDLNTDEVDNNTKVDKRS